jgi:hypothetical protein
MKATIVTIGDEILKVRLSTQTQVILMLDKCRNQWNDFDKRR